MNPVKSIYCWQPIRSLGKINELFDIPIFTLLTKTDGDGSSNSSHIRMPASSDS